jgi:dipeptidyl aminopeptidase/acylaminoacyl peptidase
MVDPRRVGAIGYSQGGVFSLLIAAETPGIKAVVAYYPVTDFEHWLYDPERRGLRKLVFKLIRGHFRRQSGVETEEEFRAILARASPLKQAERIRAPVLLIHGDRDTSAGVGESRRLENRLRELGRDVELIEIEGAGHVFNFKNAEKSRRAWQASLEWLDRHLMAGRVDGHDTGERR